MSEAAPAQPILPRNLMLGISFGQGIALLLLWRALEFEAWPSQTPAINIPLWTLAIVAPTLLLLCLDTQNFTRSLKAVGLFSGVLTLIAIFIGWQASPHGEFPIDSLLVIYVITALIACFKGLMYCQQWIAKSPSNYAVLFTYSWRNFLVVGLSVVLTWGVGLILFLWAALFAIIGIDFFKELFQNDWFLFPVLASAFGFGIQTFRRLVRVIDSITSLLEGLIRLLLPLIGVVLVIFLGALPFTTLQPLWETGNGTALLLWLNALTLFFVNAVYQSGLRSPYSAWVHRGLSAAIALLPIVSALALYGLYLRIDDYGWTVQRCWAFAVFTVLALFSIGYAWCIVRWRRDWPRPLGTVNTAMGWFVLALMLLVNTPILDFRSISLASQWQRVESGEVALRDFDFHYTRHYLARPGHQKLQALIAEYETSNPELAQVMRAAYYHDMDEQTFETLWENLAYRPEAFAPPAGLHDAASKTVFGRNPQRFNNPMLIRVDLDEDGEFEYALLAQRLMDEDSVEAVLFNRDENAWQYRVLLLQGNRPDELDITQALQNGEITATPPRFMNLQVGGLVFRATNWAHQ